MKYILLCLTAVVAGCVAVNLGKIENFHVEDFGTGYIKIAWDFVEGDITHSLHKYSLTIDSDLTSEFKCSSLSCSKTIEDLDACIEHDFTLTPVFYTPSGDDVNGDEAITSGYTTDEVPGAVNSIRVITDTDVATTLKWNPPTVNAKCVDTYNVCFRLDGESDTLCVEANSTEASVNLSACGNYHVIVIPLTPSGKEGSKMEYEFKTHDGVPGMPQDVVVGLITPETIQLLWNNPTKNPLCLDKFLITIGETHAKTMRPAARTATGYDNEFTFTPLFPCNNYTIDVCSANLNEVSSEKVVMYASTEETVPLSPPTVTVNPSGSNSIEVSWGENENDRCSGSFQVCWSDGMHPLEQCQDVGGDGDNNLIVHDLLPCSNYHVSVTVQSPNGSFVSNATTNSSSTHDVRPGPVVDLHVIDIGTDRLTVKCLPPTVDPQCVKEVITRVIDEDQKSLRFEKKTEYEEIITGLEACTNYRILVSTRSPSGLQSEVSEIRNMTLDDLPSEPQAFAVNEVTSTSITLQWFQPATNPRCVSMYQLIWEDDVYTDNITISDASSFKTVVTVDGLRPCTNINFKLFAESLVGEGPETTLIYSTAC